MRKNLQISLILLLAGAFVLPAHAQRSFRYRFSYNHTHDTLVYTKTRHYKKYQIKKTGPTTGIYNDWYKKGGDHPLSEIHYEIVNGKIEHRKELCWTRDGKLETETVYDTLKPYDITSFTRTEYFADGKTKKCIFHQRAGAYEGTYTSYYENGSVSSNGNFTNGFKTGLWNAYYENGKIKATGNYNASKTTIDADQVNYVNYLYIISNSHTQLIDSVEFEAYESKAFDSLDIKYTLMQNGRIQFPFNWYHKHGQWFYFNENSDTIHSENYAYGELVDPEKLPSFPGGYDSLKQYLATNMMNPITPGEPEMKGRVYASFMVDEKGEIWNVTVEDRWNNKVKNEVSRILNNMPPWEPALSKGQPVKCRQTICLVYRPKPRTLNPANYASSNMILPEEGVIADGYTYADLIIDEDNKGGRTVTREEALLERDGEALPRYYTVTASDAAAYVTEETSRVSEYEGIEEEGPGEKEETMLDSMKHIVINVKDSVTKEDLPFVSVELIDNFAKTSSIVPPVIARANSDFDGNIYFKNIKPGQYTVKMIYTGYKSIVQRITVTGEIRKNDLKLNLVMQSSAAILDSQPVDYSVPLIDIDVHN